LHQRRCEFYAIGFDERVSCFELHRLVERTGHRAANEEPINFWQQRFDDINLSRNLAAAQNRNEWPLRMLERGLAYLGLDPEKVADHRDVAKRNPALSHAERSRVHAEQHNLAGTLTEPVEVLGVRVPCVGERVVDVRHRISERQSVEIAGERYTLGVFVQSNFGRREDFTVLGVPVGRHLLDGKLRAKEQGSVIAIVATDAPLMAHQLKRLARRVPLGLARTGTVGNNSSGDIFLAFSTANEEAFSARGGLTHMAALGNGDIDKLFMATVEATEEAVIDAMLMAETMVGRDGNTAVALPAGELMELMRKYQRI